MPPWQNIGLKTFNCVQCDVLFNAKRDMAKYCSPLCQSRSRDGRIYEPEKSAARRKRRLSVSGYREKVNAQTNERITKVRRYLDVIKVKCGCVDCGYNKHPAALDFDHVNGKKILVSSCKSIAAANIEIEKCEARCSNCHRIVSWQRRWGHFYPCKPDIFAATYEPVP